MSSNSLPVSDRRFRNGDVVRFPFATRILQGVVKEDRGPIGVKGRRLYSVEFQPDSVSDAVSLIELPAVKLQLVEDAVSTK